MLKETWARVVVMASGLRTRLVMVALIAVVPVLGLIALGQFTARRQIHERAVDEGVRLVRLAAAQQASWFNGAHRLLQTLGRFPHLRDGSVEECVSELAAVLQDHPGFVNLGVITADGRVRCSSNPQTVGLAVEDRRWFQAALNATGTVGGAYQIGRTTGAADIVVATPVLNNRDYVIVAALDVSVLGRIITSVPLPRGSTIALIDRGGTILARNPNGAEWVGKRVAAGSNLDRLRAGAPEAINEEVGVDGIRRLYVSVPVDAGFDSGLRMSIGIDQTAELAEENRAFWRRLSSLAAVALIVMGTTFIASGRFVIRPVQALGRVTEQLSTGDFAARAKLTPGVRELNDLGDQIDMLAWALESRKIERDSAQRELHASEDRYRLLFARNPHPMWVFDRDTLAFLEVNDAAIAHYGYSREEFLAMRVADIRPAEDVPRLAARLEAGHDAWDRSVGWRHRLKDARIIDVEITTHRMMFDGRPAVVVTAIDVTDRLRAETALAERTALTTLMADVGVAFNRPQPITLCLQNCAESLVAYTQATCARIWTIDETDRHPQLQAHAEACQSSLHTARIDELTLSRLIGMVVEEGRPHFSHSVINDVSVDITEDDRAYDPGAFAGYPLVVADRVVGVMTLCSDAPLSEPIATGLVTVAKHIALGITRHRAEEAQRLLASIVTTSEDAILGSTLDGTIISWNAGAERLYGFSGTEAIGRPIAIIFPPDRLGEFNEFIEQLRLGNAVIHRETVRRRKDGTTVAVALTVSPIKDAGGRLTGKSVIVRDMSERKAAEQSLREADERMRFALEVSNVGVWEANLQTGVAYWSETCERMHGLAIGTFGRTMDAFLGCIHPDDRDRVAATTAKAVQEHQDATLDYQARWPDGTIRLISSSGRFSYNDAGEPVRGAGVAIDITDRRSLEDQLRQAQKMEAVGQLAGGIAHDFNNLLTAILGFSGFLAESLPKGDDRRQDVEEIRHAAERAASLTKQLLAFGRKQILATRVIHFGDVVAEVTPMLRRLVSEAIDLRTTTSDRGVIKADPNQLQQVLMNLVVNARDAMPDGGRLTIETSDINVDDAFARRHPGAQPGAHVVLQIRDTGIGIDVATQKRIFEPFFTTKPTGQGTGLGLATVYGIVKQSGGGIWVESEVGLGTTFTVCIPRTDEMEAVTEEAAPIASARRGDETVLLVEDEDVVREFAYKVLTRKGYKVHAVPNPQRAIEYAEAHGAPIDLVFTDVVLPGMNGKMMVTRLRARHPESKVLYMSGYDDSAIVQHGVLEIDTELLQKPFTADTLTRKIRDVLDT